MNHFPAYAPANELDQFESDRLRIFKIHSNFPKVPEDRPKVEIKMQEQPTVSTVLIYLTGIHEQPDTWLWKTVESFNTLLKLEENWDSYGAKRILPETIAATLQLLFAIMDDKSPSASIVPTAKGNVQIEWHRSGIDLEIEVTAEGKYSVLYEDHTELTDFYEDNSFQQTIFNPSKLIHFVENITERAESEDRGL